MQVEWDGDGQFVVFYDSSVCETIFILRVSAWTVRVIVYIKEENEYWELFEKRDLVAIVMTKIMRLA